MNYKYYFKQKMRNILFFIDITALLSLVLIYPCCGESIFPKGYYYSKNTKAQSPNRYGKRAGSASGNFNQNANQKKVPQKLITVVTYYDEPDLGLTLVRDDENITYRNKSTYRHKLDKSKIEKYIYDIKNTKQNNEEDK